ncbi:hypothetical protein LSH36_253g04017 [Paralvinella palmiformis]|uniref:Uncharacterized protein n=1 Tax=Paralvinella palmiformis TaxID=53620 RepID=A0AAD9JKM0_9ANNE|nr:hypothetical protein LSH36_253g04017 [Paralvinella palmiformis]
MPVSSPGYVTCEGKGNLLSYETAVLLGYVPEICEMNKMRASNLTLNREKCVFNKRHLSFFGHVRGPKGVSADPQKLEAIRKMKTPGNAEEIRSRTSTTKAKESRSAEAEQCVNCIENYTIPKAMSSDEVKNATLEDDVLQKVIENMQKGCRN